MSSDTAKARPLQAAPLPSQAEAARTKLETALAELEAALHGKLAEAERLSQAAGAAPQAEDATQWRNATHLLEEQLTALREENSLLHSEIHQLRQQAGDLAQENKALKSAVNNALKAVDAATSSVQSLLEE